MHWQIALVMYQQGERRSQREHFATNWVSVCGDADRGTSRIDLEGSKAGRFHLEASLRLENVHGKPPLSLFKGQQRFAASRASGSNYLNDYWLSGARHQCRMLENRMDLKAVARPLVLRFHEQRPDYA
jgi:hypothetical protein